MNLRITSPTGGTYVAQLTGDTIPATHAAIVRDTPGAVLEVETPNGWERRFPVARRGRWYLRANP